MKVQVEKIGYEMDGFYVRYLMINDMIIFIQVFSV